jgi:hypothetical protein
MPTARRDRRDLRSSRPPESAEDNRMALTSVIRAFSKRARDPIAGPFDARYCARKL